MGFCCVQTKQVKQKADEQKLLFMHVLKEKVCEGYLLKNFHLQHLKSDHCFHAK